MSSDPPPGGGRIGSQPPLSCNKVRGYERTPLPTRGCPPQNYKEVGRCLLIPPSPGGWGGRLIAPMKNLLLKLLNFF